MDAAGESLLYYESGPSVDLVVNLFQSSQLVPGYRLNHSVGSVFSYWRYKMKTTVIESNWDEFRRKVFSWWQKRRNDQLIKANNMHERSIRILQNRYGYTKEQAAAELDKHYSKARLG
jgi:hypothetical protein